MMKAELQFSGRIHGQEFRTFIDIAITGLKQDKRGGASAAECRELLVRLAIELTNPDQLDKLAADLAAAPSAQLTLVK